MLYFIIGGAASGKSEFAEQMVCALPGKRLYIATMTAADEESLERIRKHRERRSGLGFETLECGENLAAAEIPEGTNALLEDLSNLLANEMFSPSGGGVEAAETGLRIESPVRCRRRSDLPGGRKRSFIRCIRAVLRMQTGTASVIWRAS